MNCDASIWMAFAVGAVVFGTLVMLASIAFIKDVYAENLRLLKERPSYIKMTYGSDGPDPHTMI